MADTTTPAKTEGKTNKAPHHCGCLKGTDDTCPRMTQRAFAQGHDARMSSRLARAVAADEMTADAAEKLLREVGGSDLLVGKTLHSAKLRKADASKPKPERKPKAPKAEAEDIEPLIEESGPKPAKANDKVKVTHRVHGAAPRDFDAVIVRNASQQLVARHRIKGQNCDHDEYVAA